MSVYSNEQVAGAFRDIADMLELLGEDRFKLQAYRRAADSILDLPISVATYAATDTLETLPGIGKAIAAKIVQLLQTDKIDLHERLQQQVPLGVVAMMRLSGVGPKTAWRLYQELGIADLAALRAAATQGRIRTLRGLGSKLEATIIQRLDEAAAPPRFVLHDGLHVAHTLLATWQASGYGIVAASSAGALRRAAPTLADLDLVLAATNPQATLTHLLAAPEVAAVVHQQGTTARINLHNGWSCEVCVVPPALWGAALVLWTGNAAHRDALLRRAAAYGLRLAADGLWRDDTPLPCATEAEVYAALGLPFIAPELREGWGEIEAAERGALPTLIEQSDLRADLHMHTQWSDGGGTVRERADACLARGYRYCVITDHSAYLGLVNGLDGARLRAQRSEIDATNAALVAEGHAFRVLHGCEVDILPDGTLALPDAVLTTLDWVIASPHVSLKQNRAVATARLLQAIRHPQVDCIGHPTGRLLLQRPGLDLDMDAVLAVAAETRTVLEINGGPPRFDLDAEIAHRALGLGIRLALNSDAHHAPDLDNMRYAVLTARRAWATPLQVTNTGDWQHLMRKHQRSTL